MPYIQTVPPSEATGKLKEIYFDRPGPSTDRGRVSGIRQVQSLNVDVLGAWQELDTKIMRGECKITRRQREMIATAVSAVNKCSY
jgi:alkylhydroperoxidase family enzyme